MANFPSPLALKAQLQKDIVLVVGDDAYQKHVSNVNFTPAGGGAVTWQGGTPDAKAKGTAAVTWTANVTMIQALDDEDSLIRFFIEHEGEEVDIAYKPHANADFVQYATITIPAVARGGATTGASFNEVTAACPSTAPSTTPPAS